MKLTPEIISEVVRLVRAGNHLEAASWAAGVPYETAQRWMEKGERRRSGPQRELYLRVKRAEAESQVDANDVFFKNAKEDPKYSQAWLERRFRGTWSKLEGVQIGGMKGAPVDMTINIDDIVGKFRKLRNDDGGEQSPTPGAASE